MFADLICTMLSNLFLSYWKRITIWFPFRVYPLSTRARIVWNPPAPDAISMSMTPTGVFLILLRWSDLPHPPSETALRDLDCLDLSLPEWPVTIEALRPAGRCCPHVEDRFRDGFPVLFLDSTDYFVVMFPSAWKISFHSRIGYILPCIQNDTPLFQILQPYLSWIDICRKA